MTTVGKTHTSVGYGNAFLHHAETVVLRGINLCSLFSKYVTSACFSFYQETGAKLDCIC